MATKFPKFSQALAQDPATREFGTVLPQLMI